MMQLHMKKHSKIEQDNNNHRSTSLDVLMDMDNFLIENQNYYKKIIAPSEWVKNKFITKFNLPEDKLAVWPVGIEEFNNIRET